MQILHINNFTNSITMKADSKKNNTTINALLEPLKEDKMALIPPVKIMKGVNPKQKDVFDTFEKIHVRKDIIGYNRTDKQQEISIKEELEEFQEAKSEYLENKNPDTYYHMCDEMGDVIYVTLGLAKASGVNPKEAMNIANTKMYNRVNLMERLAEKDGKNSEDPLKNTTYKEKSEYWTKAKKMIYGALGIN